MTKQEWNNLIRSAQRGDTDAFESIYRAKLNLIMMYTSQLVYDSTLAEDAAQEVVVSMYKSITKLQHPEAFNVWLHRIILGVCVRFNKNNPVRPIMRLDEITQVPSEQETVPLPVAAVELADQKKRLLQIVDNLPNRQRLVIIMYYFDEMSYKEISQVLGITISGVAANILKAKKTIKTKMAHEGTKHEAGEALFGIGFATAIQKVADVGLADVARHELYEGLAQRCARVLADEGTVGTVGSSTVEKMTTRSPLKPTLSGLLSVLTAATVLVVGCVVVTRWDSHPINAIIQMDNSSPGAEEHINPTSISLDLLGGEGQIVSWDIETDSGERIYTGQTAEIKDILLLLPSGKYRAVWLLETKDGYRTRASREFEIRK